jgi:transposase-like protein
MYEETDTDGKRRYTVNQIATEFGVTRPTIYRHLLRSSGLSRRIDPTNDRYEPAAER